MCAKVADDHATGFASEQLKFYGTAHVCDHCVWPCIFIMFIPSNFSCCFSSLYLSTRDWIQIPCTRVVMLFIDADIVSQIVLYFTAEFVLLLSI